MPVQIGAKTHSFAEPTGLLKEHIRIEDEVVFPVASKLLAANHKAAIAEEMAQRRKP
jgi:hemerythrin-like domain-containing protein